MRFWSLGSQIWAPLVIQLETLNKSYIRWSLKCLSSLKSFNSKESILTSFLSKYVTEPWNSTSGGVPRIYVDNLQNLVVILCRSRHHLAIVQGLRLFGLTSSYFTLWLHFFGLIEQLECCWSRKLCGRTCDDLSMFVYNL